jgi:GTP cyclohydrolase II
VDGFENSIAVPGLKLPVRVVNGFSCRGAGPDNLMAIYGKPQDGCLVRIHSKCQYAEVLESQECDCGWQLKKSRELLSLASGVLIYLDQEGRGAGLLAKARAYEITHREGLDTFAAYQVLGLAPDLRDYSCAAELLLAHGFSRVQLLTNNPAKVKALLAAGITTERVPLSAAPTPTTLAYLHAKRRAGHLL